MPKDPRTRALLVHLALYCVGVAICAGVNLWLSPDRLWFVWVAFGWGIGLAAHALGYWLRHSHRRERFFVDPRARGFTVHLFAYVAVIVLLFVVNLTTGKWWFYWVALGWGAGIALHAWLALGRRHETAEVRERPKRKAPAKRKTARKKTAPKKKAARPRKSSS
jgi:hypothetical protein